MMLQLENEKLKEIIIQLEKKLMCNNNTSKLSFGSFTESDVFALSSEVVSAGPTTAAVTTATTTSTASVALQPKQLLPTSAASVWTTQKKKKKKKKNTPWKAFQIGDRLEVTVNKQESFGTFCFWSYSSLQSKRRMSRQCCTGLIHKTMYCPTSAGTSFNKGDKLIVWFIGFKDEKNKRMRLTMIEPKGE